MKKCLMLLIAVLMGWSTPVLADTVIIDGGDVLEGIVENAYFRMNTPYTGLRVARTDIKMILEKEEAPGVYLLRTINNDLFSGEVLEKSIRVALYSGETKELRLDRIRRIEFLYNGETKPVITTLFFMKNGDLFSGRMENEQLRIATGHETHIFDRAEFSRIVFRETDGFVNEALLNDGTTVSGEMIGERVQVTPECVTLIGLCKNLIKKIQFNAEKLVITENLSPGEMRYDSDGDWVPDDLDKCPDTICNVTVDEHGCVRDGDADGDGVLDRDDRCPGTPRGLTVDALGCWMVRLTHFEFDDTRIREKYYGDLDRVADILSANPDIKVEVQGHTDNRGTDAYNLRLSRERAEAVVEYLVNRGVDALRMKASGYGDSEPIDSNRTDEGRERNRRVQIVQKP